MTAILSALSSGYSPAKILQYLQRVDPALARKIDVAFHSGYSVDQVIKYLEKNGNRIANILGKAQQEEEPQRENLYKKAQKSISPAVTGAAKFAGKIGAAALGGYALSRALPKAGQALTGELLPAIPKPPPPSAPQLQLPGMARQALPAPGQAAMQPEYPLPGAPGEGPLPYSNPTAQGMQSPNSPVSPGPLQPQGQPLQTPQAQAAQQAPNIPTVPNAPPLPEKLQKFVSSMLAGPKNKGKSFEDLGLGLKQMYPQDVKQYEKATGQPIARAIEDFAKTNPVQAGKPEPMAATQPIKEEVKDLSDLGGMAKGMTDNLYEGVFKSLKEGKDTFAGIKDPLITKAKPYFEKGLIKSPADLKDFANNPEKFKENEKPLGKTVALPNGDIGEVTDIRQGIATVNVDGKEHTRKLDELEQAPEGLEETAERLVNLIPEKEKSSMFQESIHLTLPGMEGEEMPLMISKFYSGKWAWYLGVSNDDYSRIALGTFEPKTKGKTGIAEYNPGIIDSRGAGMQELIIQNPKYSKANRGKTWDYADTKYDMMKSIQPALLKLSKQRKDEKGNIVAKGERKPAEKSAPSPKLPPLHNEEVKEKETTKKLSKEDEAHLFKKKEPKAKEKPAEKKEVKPRENAPEKKEEKHPEKKPPQKLRLKELSAKAHEPKKGRKDDYERMKNLEEFEKELKKIDEPLKKFERPDITAKGLKTQKEFILNKLEDALKNPDDSKEYINIDVPGDGHFRIVNLKESLEKFSEKVEKKWPTKPLPSTMPKTYKR